jgi:hypothetical protein
MFLRLQVILKVATLLHKNKIRRIAKLRVRGELKLVLSHGKFLGHLGSLPLQIIDLVLPLVRFLLVPTCLPLDCFELLLNALLSKRIGVELVLAELRLLASAF